ncbi:MAG TPA: glycosyltransferase family 39 protein [Candidatus Hydrogenedentes bacterium]|nr:glycosyltransferase family 39 protein [Candidatus Hydrogenedentota bacterium]HOS02623.1 glycosyltransferase family 39 protein [Candidatus Hydrogenedentota bacterium]
MSANILEPSGESRAGRKLFDLCLRCMIGYLLGMAALWVIGVEGIYLNATPFYAYLSPVFDSLLVPAAALLLMGAVVFVVRRWVWPRERVSWRRTGAFAAVWLFAVLIVASAIPLEARQNGVTVAAALASKWAAFRWNVLAVVVFTGGLIAWIVAAQRLGWRDGIPSERAAGWMLVAIVFFVFVFSASIALLRDGIGGITMAYDRHASEYIGDIGRGMSIRGLFRDYLTLHPYLSMHAKVHPPGPIAMLWLLSYVAGRGSFGLSLATMAVGSLSVVPLYYWVRDLFDRRVALTCCLLFALMPSVVLFTATSADILFMPLTLTTLFLFWRAMHRASIGYACGAGVLYAAMSLTSFSLVSVGAFFGFVGLWRMLRPEGRLSVIRTAVVMGASFLATHALVYFWSGFDIVACFWACHDQFRLDQTHLDALTPRLPAWTYWILNPMCWLYFAGIPTSVLCLRRWSRPEAQTKALFLTFLLTLVALNFLYLARGEGERSAMYVMIFFVIPAAQMLDRKTQQARSLGPIVAACSFLGLQCWFTESLFNTYW